MNLSNIAEPLHVSDSNLSGSSFRDINMSDSEICNAKIQRLVLRDVDLSASRISNTNLSQVQIEDCNLDGMSIDGVLVSDLFAAYRSARV